MTFICHQKLLTAGLRIIALRRLGKCHFSSSKSRHPRLLIKCRQICRLSISAPLTDPFICRCHYSSALPGTSAADTFKLPVPIERIRQNWMRILREEQRAKEQRARHSPWLGGITLECTMLKDWKEGKPLMELSTVGISIETTALKTLKPPDSIELCPLGTSAKSSSIFGTIKQITSHSLFVLLDGDHGRDWEDVRFQIRKTPGFPVALEILENGEEWHKMPGFPAMLWAYGCDNGEWPKTTKPNNPDNKEQPHSPNMDEEMGLDEHQRTAMAAALDPDRPIVAVHGPPGTGKSMLAVEYIRAEIQSGKRVVAVCASNSSMYSLVGHYLQRTAGSDPQLHEHILFHAPYESEKANQLISDTNTREAIECRTLRHLLEEQGFRGNYTTEHIDARNRIIRDCSLQFCTPGKAALSLIALAKAHFDVVVIEQANLLNEPDSWAMILPLASHVRLFGDSHQLRRPLSSEIAREQNFGRSLLQYLEEKDDNFCQGQQVNFHLRIQYRSHPAIHHWSNTVFYKDRSSEPAPSVVNLSLGELLSGTSDSKWPENLITEPMVLIDTSLVGVHGGGWAEWMFKTREGGASLYNEGEALLIASYLCRLHRLHTSGFHPSQIAVFHNYMAQRNRIMSFLSILNRNGLQFSPTQIHRPEGFLGRHFDIVLDNPVKDATEIYKQHLDLQYLNHKITRARRQFVFVANSKQLRDKQSPMGKELDELIRTFEQKGRIMAPGELMPLRPGEFENIMKEKNDQLRRGRGEMRKRAEEMKDEEEDNSRKMRWKEAEMEEIEERMKMRQVEEDEERKIMAKRNQQQTIEQLEMKLRDVKKTAWERGQTIQNLEMKLRDRTQERKLTEKEQIIHNLGKKLRDKNETMRNFEAELRDMETMVEGIGQHTTKLEMKLQHARKMAKKRGQMIKKLLKWRLRNMKRQIKRCL